MSDTNAPYNRAKRYTCTAGVSINGFDGQALIENINLGGFCMTSRTYVTIARGERYSMQILPEPSAQIETIELDVEVRWTRVTESLFSVGFQIRTANSELKKYIAYLEGK